MEIGGDKSMAFSFHFDLVLILRFYLLQGDIVIGR